jgi:heme/copper-type cytochrome/quinol oxidase subunit 2
MLKKYWLWILVGLSALAAAFAPVPFAYPEPQARIFHIHASSYEYYPGVLRANPGDEVTIHLTSTDVVHGLYIDGYNLDVRADPGQSQSLTFTADRSGSFRFRCSVTCGDLHPFMIGKFSVGYNTLLIRAGLLSALAVLAAAMWRRP